MADENKALTLEILLVEDNPADVRLTAEALKAENIPNNLNVVEDGTQAMAYLRREGRYGKTARPGLVLLDLNLPKKSGHEVLREIKEDPSLRTIPVVILTMSKAEEDIERSYLLRADCYVTKPVDFTQFKKVVTFIRDFLAEHHKTAG